MLQIAFPSESGIIYQLSDTVMSQRTYFKLFEISVKLAAEYKMKYGSWDNRKKKRITEAAEIRDRKQKLVVNNVVQEI